MFQTTRSVVLEVQPQSSALLASRIDALKASQETGPEWYAGLKAAVPLLHFMCVTIFADDQYDPILVVEVNFDGPEGPFWAQFEAALGEPLRDMLRCGKTPRDKRGVLFTRVTENGSRAPMAPLMEALTVKPAVAHQGNRGLDRARIAGEGQLFASVQTALDGGIADGADQQTMHAKLRSAMLPHYDWLDVAASPRISVAESRADYGRLAGLVAMLVVALLLPGSALALFLGPYAAFAVLVVLGFVLKSRLAGPDDLTFSPAVIGKLPLVAAGLFVAVTLFAMLCGWFGAIHDWHVERFWQHVRACWPICFMGAVGLFPLVYGAMVWIRWLELRDPPQDLPKQDPAVLRAMLRREDKIAQNHMGSVVHIKPGILRAVVVRVALHALGLVLRVIARDGYLGSMRTIHFAHWAIVSNGSRLLFFSNFDGSWESYLDDFIEKAHVGLTLAWTSCVGFPPTRFLVTDGATQGRKFKAWARHSMAESLFWYSAYNSFTVNQIERQARVADGLRQPSLSAKDAQIWALDL